MRAAVSLSVPAALVAALLCSCSEPASDDNQPIETLPPDSREDMALAFDGVDDYGTTGTAGFPFPRLPQTVSFWIAAGSGGSNQVIATLRKDRGSGVSVGLCGGAVCARSVYSGDNYAIAPDPLPAGEWHHVAYEFDGSGNSPHHTLYVDAVAVATGTALPNNRTPTTGFVGSMDGAELFFGGQLDEFRIWSVARTPEQLLAEMAGQAPEQEPPDLLVFYTFNEASGARVIDRSGRGNHALLGDGNASLMPRRVVSTLPKR